MILKKRIPKDFYRLFRTRNMDAYMEFLVAIYEENNEVYAALGLTREECMAIIRETMAKNGTVWQEDAGEESSGENQPGFKDSLSGEENGVSSSMLLGRLIDWGWLNSDYDEKMNSYVISFPEYSQLYVELFRKLQSEDDSRERESILSIYSALYTFHADPDRNNGILQNALHTSRRLGQLLSNMQDGMRGYFDKLSGRKNFIGIQEVLVEEINNSDSRKYAILTTTDSFYRYKEAVKELISQILQENDQRRQALEDQMSEMEAEGKQEAGETSAEKEMVLSEAERGVKNEDMTGDRVSVSREYRRCSRAIEICGETASLICSIEREFDQIERKYNKLIEQKTIFAKRALARVRYILQEGTNENDDLIRLLNLLDKHPRREEILEELRSRIGFGASYEILTDGSFYQKREKSDRTFRPVVSAEQMERHAEQMTDFIPKPLYTKKQLREFREKNTHNGRFTAAQETVRSVEDLEKLMFLWQEETEIRVKKDRIIPGEEIETGQGFRFSGFSIEEID
ncbi:MAG: DUF5716 family protein [Lachnospiraceae bacterium]|nr:DUF5716 family protein [Lachnospiraceae bacterium]